MITLARPFFSLKRAVCTVAVLAPVAMAGYYFLHSVFNPKDLNHLVVVNSGHDELTDAEVVLKFEKSEHHIPLDAMPPGTMRVINIEYAFRGGTLTVASRQRPFGPAEILPPGRYGGTLRR
jgi:hypothetical protein